MQTNVDEKSESLGSTDATAKGRGASLAPPAPPSPSKLRRKRSLANADLTGRPNLHMFKPLSTNNGESSSNNDQTRAGKGLGDNVKQADR